MQYLPTIIALLIKYGPEAVQIAEIYGPPAVKFAQAVWPLIEQTIDKQSSDGTNLAAALAAVGHPTPGATAAEFLNARLSAMS